MPSPTPRVGLPRPLAGEAFIPRTSWSAIFDQLDALPGIHICTSTTHPGMGGGLAAWGTAHTGMFIFETDTNLLWRWSGSQFNRAEPVGLLGQAQLATPYATSATAPAVALSVSVTVPATHVGSTAKRIKVSAAWKQIDNGDASNGGLTIVTLRRQPGNVVLQTQNAIGRPNSAVNPLDRGSGGTIFGLDNFAGGAAVYELCINADATVGGASSLRADASNPATIVVEEIGT